MSQSYDAIAEPPLFGVESDASRVTVMSEALTVSARPADRALVGLRIAAVGNESEDGRRRHAADGEAVPEHGPHDRRDEPERTGDRHGDRVPGTVPPEGAAAASATPPGVLDAAETRKPPSPDWPWAFASRVTRVVMPAVSVGLPAA